MSALRDRPEIVVVSPLKEWTCAACGDTDVGWLIMDDGGPLCISCAGLAHLAFLGAGDAALTRRARKHSRLSAVVVRFSRARRRYERQGVLVEESALEQAEAECLADKDVRLRRRQRERERRAVEDAYFERELANEIGRLFPACPSESLDPTAITLAVAATARHRESEYDDLLMAGVDRSEARERVRATVDSVLEAWRTPPG